MPEDELESLNSIDEDIEFDIDIIRNNAAQALNFITDRGGDPFLKFHEKPQGLGPSEKKRYNRLKKSTEAKQKSKSVEQLGSYDLWHLVPPPYDLQNLAKLFELNAAHNAAVKAKATNIVGLGYEWKETKAVLAEMEDMNQKERHDKQKELNKERIKLDDKLEDLTEDEDFNEVLMKVWMDVESIGNGYLEISRNNNGKPGKVWHVPASTMRIRVERDGFIQVVGQKYTFFRNFGDQETPNPLKNDPTPNEIIHLRKYSPNSTFYGIPDIVAALSAVAGDKYAREYNIDYFENKAVPRYAFIVKGAKLSPQAEQNLIKYFQNELKGKNHGTLYIPLPAGFNQNVEAKFEKLEVGVQEGSFIKYLQENRQEVLMVHRTPPAKVGVFLNMNLAISRDADRTFREQVCRPEQRRVEKKLKNLFKEFTNSFVFKFLETDVIDGDIKSRIHDRYLRTQVLTPNDVLRELGLPTRKDGDKVLPYGPQLKALPPGAQGPNAAGAQKQQKSASTSHPTVASQNIQSGTQNQKGEAQDKGEARPKGPRSE